jgi:hypothetical protein
MRHVITAVRILGLALVLVAPGLDAQEITIGIVDFYGLRRVPEAEARRALAVKEGDTLSLDGGMPTSISESVRRLERVPGVTTARLQLVCCEDGRTIVYVGIEEAGTAAPRFRDAPRGSVQLVADVIHAVADLEAALGAAVRRGDNGEDDSQGHALAHDPASRAIQLRFIDFAKRDLALLRRVLRDATDEKHRAAAAEVLGYASDKQAVVPDLLRATLDPSESVRKDAMRALLVFARAETVGGRPRIRVSAEPFIDLLNSPTWTDRNKSSAAVEQLTQTGDPAVLATVRRRGQPGVYALDAAGGRPQLVTEPGSVPSWSRDGKWIYFNRRGHTGRGEVWNIAANSSGRLAVQITDTGGGNALESPDGKTFYYRRPGSWGLFARPVAGGPDGKCWTLHRPTDHTSTSRSKTVSTT